MTTLPELIDAEFPFALAVLSKATVPVKLYSATEMSIPVELVDVAVMVVDPPTARTQRKIAW